MVTVKQNMSINEKSFVEYIKHLEVIGNRFDNSDVLREK